MAETSARTNTVTQTDRNHQGVDERFVLQKVQPALLGLMDGSVSTLAPLFAAAGLTNSTRSAFFVGLAASIGAAITPG
jgi:erythrin-vacuolar iron transport family protein